MSFDPQFNHGILGRNGSGKSTFAASLGGTLVSFETEDALLERELREDDTDFLDCIDQGRTVRELLVEVSSEVDDEIETIAASLGLTALLDQGFLTLSTGERRRLMLARALAQNPELLVLDEPFDGLDQAFRKPLKKLFTNRRLHLVANRLSDLEGLVTHLALIEDGEVILSGPFAEIAAHPLLRQLTTAPQDLELPTPISHDLPEGPLVSLRNVTVIHGGREILSNLSLTIERGQNWKISGPNGCGKSTLVNLITGDHPQCYSNDVSVFGMRRGGGESIWDIKEGLGIVSPALQSQYRVGVDALSVVVSGFFDSVGLYQSVTPEQLTTARQWLALVGMAEHERGQFRRLSYGQQRLLLIARALVKQPPLLILDEPCQGLDPINRSLVLGVIDRIAATGLTQLIYITHEPEDRLECITDEFSLAPVH